MSRARSFPQRVPRLGREVDRRLGNATEAWEVGASRRELARRRSQGGFAGEGYLKWALKDE